MVRIRFPPAKSLLRTRFLMGMGFRNAVFRSYGARSPLPGRALRLRSDRAVAIAGEVADLQSAGPQAAAAARRRDSTNVLQNRMKLGEL